MQKSPTLPYYIGATVLAVLVGALFWLFLQRRPPLSIRDSGAMPSGGNSYEQTVHDEQMHWGHGHTVSDPSPPSAQSGAASNR